MKQTYTVAFKTRNQRGAGSGARIRFTLIGPNGQVEGTLTEGAGRYFGNRLRPGEVRCVSIEAEHDIGAVDVVLVDYESKDYLAATLIRTFISWLPGPAQDMLKGVPRDPATWLGLDNAWCLESVDITHADTSYHVPVYSWLNNRDEATSTIGFATNVCLPQFTPEHVKPFRDQNLEDPQKSLGWITRRAGAIPALSTFPLPLNYNHTDRKAFDFYKGMFIAGRTAVSGMLLTLRHTFRGPASIPSFDTYNTFFNKFGGPPRITKDWKDDALWGSTFLTGPCAGHFHQVDTLPQRLAHLNDSLLQSADGEPHPYMNGASLKAELEAGRIFLADLSIFNGLELRGDDIDRFLGPRHCAPSAVVLLRAATERDNFEMLPIAIQLEESANAPIWLPSDDEWDWLTAKAYIMNAASVFHLMHLHWSQSHNAAGVFAAAVKKCFSDLHPLRALLNPHANFTVGLNRAAQGLLSPRGSGGTTGVPGPTHLFPR